MDKDNYKWKFASVGGAARVDIQSGEDIARLGELDRKMWTVLSNPVKDLEFDQTTLKVIDSNGDGIIHVDEVIEAAKWITGLLRNPDDLLKGQSELPLSDFNTDNPEGATLQKSARQILENLKLEKDSICLEDTADNARIFAGSAFNGDGVITEISTPSQELKDLIKTIVTISGGAPDRTGETGITTEQIEAFYAACEAYSAWKSSVTPETFPYGDATADALAAVEAVKAKVADFFMRCKLINFNPDASAAVDVDVEKIKAISEQDLAVSESEIANYPLARPNADGKLPLKDGINPAWRGQMAAVAALIKDFEGKEAVTEAEWNAATGKFAPYCAWLSDKKGSEVESLGDDAVKAVLKDARKEELLSLVASDKALEEEALSIEKVDKVLHLYRDFYSFLNNYVTFKDFYSGTDKAIFQAGELYIDQRRCDLCVKVDDMGKQTDMAGLSWMYILYLACRSKTTSKNFNIAAVVTDGETRGLRVGKNAIFYDRAGEVYDATVTQIIDNPISIRQAFWAPYRKFGKWISERFNKKASEKNDQGFADMTAKAEGATATGATPAKSSFDIAKFAGIFAAIGMALGFLLDALVQIVKGAATVGPWKVVLIIVAIMLVISAPSVILTWIHLRHRDLGPILNANGWAVNAASYVSVKFGRTLTSLAKFPKLTAVDAKARKARRRRIFWTIFIILLLAAAAYCWWRLHFHFV